jgi:hypothetical protein
MISLSVFEGDGVLCCILDVGYVHVETGIREGFAAACMSSVGPGWHFRYWISEGLFELVWRLWMVGMRRCQVPHQIYFPSFNFLRPPVISA